jgi:F0F1-type ATP synthase assembly protein I
MEPAAHNPRPGANFSLAGAGSVLIGTTAAVIVVGALIGWAAGSLAWGFLVGALVGIPAGIALTIARYGNAR